MGKSFRRDSDNRFRKVEGRKFDKVRDERRRKEERRAQAYATSRG